jgi:hypothetical protein
MDLELEPLPGMTRRPDWDLKSDAITPANTILSIPRWFQRKVFLIATASINDGNIYNNGLYQNCFILYRLAEAIGWLPIFVVNSKPKDLNGIPEFLRKCRIAQLEDILQQPVPVKVYLEVGMSISPNLRRHMKMLGARTCKLYLGNILNIDIETPMFLRGIHFSHHVIGEQDEIWVSPHYTQHAEYAAVLNHVEPVAGKSMRIAPYVWDPIFLTDDAKRNPQWRPRRDGEIPTVLVMEPNISFQKSALVPILIAEEWSRAHPDIPFNMVVLNGDRLLASGYFKANIEPNLTIAKKGYLKYGGRHSIIEVMNEYPHATAICSHFNNEYNYMVFEFLWAGFPVLHNCWAWRDFGYYYPEQDVEVGAKVLHEATMNHTDRLEAYKGHAKALAWRHSIYNPEIQKAWSDMLEGK